MKRILVGSNKSCRCCDKIKTKCPICGEYDEHTLGSIFSLKERHAKNAPICKNCSCSITSSKADSVIENYISTIYKEECIRNNRDILDGKELDIYYPEKKIAIEFNGDYWHNENHKCATYHNDKFKMCYNKGIILVSIFESEWRAKELAIKQYLKDLFDGKENCISFNNDTSLMNNNYPIPNCLEYQINSVIDDYYSYDKRKVKVYTCGYSKLIQSLI